jgi:hypothetical protein
MTDSDEAASAEDASAPPWGLLGAGGALSLCCLVAAPTAGAAAAGGATASLSGHGLVRIAVTALTIGIVGGLYRIRSSGCACDASAGTDA